MSKKTSKEDRMVMARGAFDYFVTQSKKGVMEGKPTDSCVYSIMEDEGGTIAIFPIPIGDTVDAKERLLIMESMGELLAEKKQNVLIFVTLAEAWVSQQPKTAGGQYIRPKDDPKRREVLMISAKDLDGNTRNIAYEIKRKKSGIDLQIFPLFGKGQTKSVYEWVSKEETKARIENALVDTAWRSYNETKLALKKK